MRFDIAPRVAAAFLACVLASCGGGLGSTDGDAAGTLDQGSITAVGIDGTGVRSNVVTMSVQNATTLYYGIATADDGAATFDFEPRTDTSGVFSMVSSTVPPGTTHSGTVTFKLCGDAACTQLFWSQRIPYTVTMFRIDTSALAIQGHENADDRVTLAISPPDTGHVLSFSTSTSFLAVSHQAPDSLVVTASAAGLADGSGYTGSIDVHYAIADGTTVSPGSLPVAFTVGSGIVGSAPAARTLAATSTAAELSGSIPVAIADGTPLTWTAASDSDWLVLDTAAGAGAGTIAWHVDPARFAALGDWATATAHVTIHAPPMTDLSLPVQVSAHLPEVDAVVPDVLRAGATTTVHVTGRGLSQLSGIGAFAIGGLAPVGGNIDSDTSATLQMPALAAGQYALALPNAVGVAAPSTPVSVTADGLWAPQPVFVAGAASGYNAVFDFGRMAVYATSGPALLRYRMVGGRWQVTSVPSDHAYRLALAPDRSTVYTVSTSALTAVDPDDMSTRGTYALPEPATATITARTPLAITSDQRLWVPSDVALEYFDLRTGSFGMKSDGAVYEPKVYAPEGGRRAYVVNSLEIPQYTGWYDAATETLSMGTGTGNPGGYDFAFDAAGSVMLAGDLSLYRTSDLSLVGALLRDVQDASGVTFQNGALSPDGRRLYVVAIDRFSPYKRIEAFDTTLLAPDGTRFTDLGPIAIPADAQNCPDGAVSTCNPAQSVVVSPDGSTLYLVGDAGMAVLPIPAALSGIASPAQSPNRATGLRLRRARVVR